MQKGNQYILCFEAIVAVIQVLRVSKGNNTMKEVFPLPQLPNRPSVRLIRIS